MIESLQWPTLTQRGPQTFHKAQEQNPQGAKPEPAITVEYQVVECSFYRWHYLRRKNDRKRHFLLRVVEWE